MGADQGGGKRQHSLHMVQTIIFRDSRLAQELEKGKVRRAITYIDTVKYVF